MHTACYPVHPLHEKFCYQNYMSFCLHLTLLSCRIGAFILQAQVFRYPGFLLLRHKFISLFMIFGVQIQTTNYQPGYFVLFFFLCYMVKINKIIYLHPLKPHPMSGKAQHWNLVVKCSVLFVSRDKREHNSSIYQYTRYVALVLIHSCSMLCKLTSNNYLLKASCMLIKRYSSAIQSNSIVFFYLCLKPYEEMNIILPFSNHEAERILCR